MACPNHLYTVGVGYPHRNWWWFCIGTIYLYIVLDLVKIMKGNPFQSILVMVTGFLIFGYFFPGGGTYWQAVAIAVSMLALLSKAARNGILWVWEKISLALGWFNGRVFLSLIFLVFLTPLAWIYRIFNKNVLCIQKPEISSMWATRDHLYEPKDLDNPW